MVRLTGNKTLRDDLVKKGIPQAEKFSWRSMAENVLGIYNEIFSKSKVI
jgi:hypothetical protein